MNIIISFISRSEVLCILLVLQMMVASIVGLPVHQRHTTSSDDAAEPARRRFSRKVGNLNITSSPEQYVRELYDNYVSESNTRTAANRATDVWCFPDKGEHIFIPCQSIHGFQVFHFSLCTLFPMHRCSQGDFPAQASQNLQMHSIYTIPLSVELHCRRNSGQRTDYQEKYIASIHTDY